MITKFKFLIHSVIAASFLGCGNSADLGNQVDAIFAGMDSPSKPGCACSVMKNGDIIHQAGYGMAN